MAVLIDEIWDTKSNEEAQRNAEADGAGAAGLNRTHDASSWFEKGNEVENPNPETKGEAAPAQQAAEDLPFTEAELLKIMKSAYTQGVTYQQSTLQPRWARAYNAWNNEHNSDSKYKGIRYRGRSRLYRPKTRATVRKKSAEAAAGLFSTGDAIIVNASNPRDEQQLASAAMIQELVNYRLDRSNENAGIPWFMICMGAHLSGQLTALSISKQYWEYKTVTEQVMVPAQTVQIELGPGITMPIEQPARMEERVKVIKDRPRIQLIPPENCIRDPAAPWEDQAQESSYLIIRYPMPLTEARDFISNQSKTSAVQFLPIDDAVLAASAGTGAGENTGAAATRRARDQSSNDPLDVSNVDKTFQTVWLHENFMRIEGTDWVFWTLEDKTLISNVVTTEEAYPEQGGARPIAIGVTSLDPFKVDPMSPVESWQPLQQEMNDIVNLRLDTLKQTIAPLAKVRRGRSVDVKAIQNRGPDTVVYMQELTDLEFDRPGDVSQASYAEMEKLNADFDDQAGNFSIGSVQTNRQLGETVGGMKMMTSNANAMGEFDLRVWIETWVEPVLRQLVKLEQYYESDMTVLAMCGEKAQLLQKFKQSPDLDQLLTNQVTLTCNVGIGAADPMLSLDKFAKATEIAAGVIGESFRERVKQDEVINEVYGKAGYKDAAERFFHPLPEEDQRLQQAQQMIQQAEAQIADLTKKLEDKQAEIAARIKVAQISTLGGLAKQEMSVKAQEKAQFRDAAMGAVTAEQDRQFQREQGASERDFQREQVAGDRQFQAEQGAMQREQSLEDRALDMAQNPEQMDGDTVHQMLGLKPDPTAQQALMTAQQGLMQNQAAMEQNQQAMQMLARMMLQGFQQMAEAMMQGNATLAQAIEQNNMGVIESIAQSSRDQAIATNKLAKAIMAPKKIVRGADGLATSVVAGNG